VLEGPAPEVIDDTKPTPLTALNAVNRQLASVNAVLTELQVASERSETTALLLKRINAEWDVLEARLKVLAKTAVDHAQWTREPVDKTYERLHKLLEGGIGCGEPATQLGEQQEFLEQLRRLTKRLLINWDKRRDASTHVEDLTGRTMGGFILRGQIAVGGFGAVYGCDQPLLGREAVVKVLHHELRRSQVIVRRFLREALLASRLDHPYAVHIYAFGIEEQDRVLWIAMERVQGVTLAEWLKLHGPMPLGQLVPFFERIAAVVHTAHERGIVHRDLKPSNVMVIERAGELLPKLLDFGVAKVLDNASPPEEMLAINYPLLLATEDSANHFVSAMRPPGKSTVSDDPAPHPDDDRLTQNNHTVGSPPYIPPEQWSNAVTVGPAADLYALAVVAFEALTGRRPFQGKTMADYTEQHCHAQVPPLGGSFSPALDPMFQRALAKRPRDRWATALELAAALRVASGIGTTRSDLPRLDRDVCDAWLAAAPQPLAESIAELGGAHHAYQARDIAKGLILTFVRYLLAMALAMNARHPSARRDPALLELTRTMNQRVPSMDKRIRLLRLLVHRLAGVPGLPLVSELLALVTTAPAGTDAMDRLLVLYTATDHAISEEMVRLQLLRLIPELSQLLRQATFVLDYLLVVPRNRAPERWTGQRCRPRALAHVSGGGLVDGHPMLLDREARVYIDLWPLVQAVPPTEGAEPELFLFEVQGPHGALQIAAPSGLKRQDAVAGDWVAAHVIAALEPRSRVRDQLRDAVLPWNRDRPDAQRWRGKLLAAAVAAIVLGVAALALSL
jgi:serine/threonine protein kinase